MFKRSELGRRARCIAVFVIASCFLQTVPAGADTPVFAHLDEASAAGGPQLLNNAGFEEGNAAPVPGWYFWKEGYARALGEGRDGGTAIRCTNSDPRTEYGAGQTIQLNQTQPLPLIVTGWSRAENVSAPANRDYSIYIDAMYTDDTPLWGVISSFSAGTHDWEKRRCVVLPEKPLKSITVYALFRNHTGTAWFDDFALHECSNADIHLFENVAIALTGQAALAGAPPSLDLPATTRGLILDISAHADSPATGLYINGRVLGQAPIVPFIRDVAVDSNFMTGRLVRPPQENNPREYEWDFPNLALRLRIKVETEEACIRFNGTVEDLRGSDRAVTVFVPIPLAGKDWAWWRDIRRSTSAQAGAFMNTCHTNAGATGECSRYPLAAVTNSTDGIALATPITNPRHCRLVYNADLQLLFAAFDLGLAPDTPKFPQSATFEALLYSFEPQWGFRAALEHYYELFPESFMKRVDREGLWMAFTDISTVNGWEDFGFAFKEGNNNVGWDEANNILTFVYTEPMTTWLPLPTDIPREKDAALAHLASLHEKESASKRHQASVTLLSSVHDADGNPVVYLRDTPWCDGALFPLNADPDLPTSDVHPMNQAQSEWAHLDRTLSPPERDRLTNWNHYERGYEVDDTVFDAGKHSLRVSLTEPAKAGATQTLSIDQTEPEPLVLRARVRTQGLSGGPDNDCAVYVDLVHTDGTPLWGRTLPIPPGTSEFVTLERTIESEKPFKHATVHLLMRGDHTGTVWFDELFLGPAGAENNLLRDPGFEGPLVSQAVVDGVYIDSFVYFASTLNYRRDHFASIDFPLVFDEHSQDVGIMTLFSTFEFEREIASRVHERGKLMMANAPLHAASFPAAYLDVLGTETNWFPRGEWQPMSDESMAFRRAMCYRKPYCFLLNTRYADLDLEDIERYIQRCLFYGMYPGLFSENASTDCFFENPEWYEPARPLFRKYIPLIQMISQAGWQPLTHARADGEIYIERFGNPEKGAVYFTLLNETDAEIRSKVRTCLESLNLKGQPLTLNELITEEKRPAIETDSELHTEMVLPPHTARLLRLETTKRRE